jgi:hypothetical protein
MFFQLAVIGPIAGDGLGTARRCLACYHATRLTAGTACTGFGPGCLSCRPIRIGAAADSAAGAGRRSTKSTDGEMAR